MLKTVTLRAHAKINLVLDVLNKREDGYHDIETIFQTVHLADRITFTPNETEGITISCDDPNVPLRDDNLITKAYNAFFAKTGLKPFGIEANVVKKIPMQAGLGGGSSDAAAMLRALAIFNNIESNSPQLFEIAASIGADVSFFLYGGAVFAEGIGEKIEHLPDFIQSVPMAIAKPGCGVDTKWAYEQVDSAKHYGVMGNCKRTAEMIKSGMAPNELLSEFRNSFQDVIFDKTPDVKQVSDDLKKIGAVKTLLCGSGSAVAGFFNTPHQSRFAADLMRRSGRWATNTYFVPTNYALQSGEYL